MLSLLADVIFVGYKKIRFMKKTFFCLAAALFLGISSQRLCAEESVFSETFDTQEDFDEWTIINVEEGSTTWTYRTSTGKPMQSKCAQILKHSPNAANDWLISPAFTLKAGTVYELSFRCTPGTFNKAENLKAYLGTGITVESMTTELLELNGMLRDDTADITRTAEITVDADGTYHVGFLGCSDPNMGRIDLDDVVITAKAAAIAPGPVTELTATAAAEGALSATLSFTAPTVTATGDALSAISSIEITRDAAVVATITNPAPGEALEYTDATAVQGQNTYEVVCYSEDGSKSVAASVTVFVGIDVPVAIVNPRASSLNDGNISLSWQAPTASVNGGYFNPETLSYTITDLSSGETVTATGTTYTLSLTKGEQKVYEYSIAPVTEAGTGEAANFNRVIMGNAITEAYSESFAGAVASSPWYQDSDEHAFDWIVDNPENDEYSDPDVKGYTIYAQDKDGGDLIVKSLYAYEYETSRYCSPIFSLSQFANPVLTFYQINGPKESLKVQVRTIGGEWQEVAEPVWETGIDGLQWSRCSVPLSNLKDGEVQFSFLAYGGVRPMHIDNITIAESNYSRDMAVRSITASPQRANVGETTTFTADIRNFGGQNEATYEVVLYRDGNEVDRKAGAELAATASTTVDFQYTSTLDDAMLADKSEWTAQVVLADDENAGNDTSDAVVWSTRPNDVPDITDLAATSDKESVTLNWSAGINREAAEKGEMQFVTDGFETYTPFAIDGVGDWTFVDKDGAETWKSNYPTREHVGEPLSFMVFNTEEGGVETDENQDNIFFAHSGKQYLMGFSNEEYGTANNDWLITPRLDGRSHTVDFYTRIPMGMSGDDVIAVSYSATDTDPDSFLPLNDGQDIYVSDNWKHVEVTVPDGAKYFAVNLKLSRMFYMIDDFTYAAHDGSLDPLTLLGYNVYRNGEKINEDLIADNTYVDSDMPEGENTYTVTAVYEQGESRYSNEAKVNYSSVGAIDGASAMITAHNGILSVAVAKTSAVAVYSIDGKKVASATVAATHDFSLAAGAYIVTVNGKATKMVMR